MRRLDNFAVDYNRMIN